MHSDLSRELSDLAIQRTVGPRSFAAGLAYARAGRVTDVRVDPQGRLVYASVQGTRPTPYAVIVAPSAQGARWSGQCTCPVAFDCKHVAATMIAARSVEAHSDWEGEISALVSSRAELTTAAADVYALQVEVVDARASGRFGQSRGSGPAERLRLRPVIRGRSGAWVRTGATWATISGDAGGYGGYAGSGGSGGYGARTRPALEALQAIFSTFQSRSRGYYGYGDVALHLDDLGPMAWALLAQLCAAGVPLILSGSRAAPVLLASEPVRVVLDLTQDETGAQGARLAPVLIGGARRAESLVDDPLPESGRPGGHVRLDAGRVQLVGEPAHGLFVRGAVEVDALLRTQSPPLPPGAARPALVLACFEAALDPHVDRLVRGPRALEIPAADLPRFLLGYYPGVRQVVEVVSSDDSVQLPETLAPQLALTVTFGPDHEVDLDWGFAYGSEDDGLVPLNDGDVGDVGHVGDRAQLAPQSRGVFRDPAAERALLDSLTAVERDLLGSDLARLNARRRLTGMDSVAFARDVLPGLRRDEQPPDPDAPSSVRTGPTTRPVLTLVGDVPDFRPAESDPVIRLTTTDSGAGSGRDGDGSQEGAEPGAGSDWFDLGISVTVDGEDVPFDRLFVALAYEQTHLVLPSGVYLSLDRPELLALGRLIEEARSLSDRESDGLRLNIFQAGLWEELVALGVVEAQSGRWAAAVQGLLDVEESLPPPVPDGFAAELRPYQLDGYRWLTFLWQHGLGGILADDMGLGKTVQTLAMMCHARDSGDAGAPFLVVAPTSVVGNWVQEARRFAPGLKVVAVTETSAKRRTPLAEDIAGADLVVTSYALFRIDFDSYLGLPWAGLVLDEAQVVKNHQAKTYQCARRLPAPFKLAVTGTPLENSLMDLWSLLSIVAPGLYPSPQKFTEAYRRPIERGDDPKALARLRRRVRPLMLRRRKEDVVTELPPKQEQVLEVVLNPKHQRVYQTHLQRERQKVLGLLHDLDKNRFAIFRSLTLLRQLSLDAGLVDPAYADVRSSKADAFLEQLQEVVAEGHRALVFSQFTGFLRVVREQLDAAGIAYSYLDGSTRGRPARIQEWKTGDAPVFLISLKAGGVGLNLTEADYVFILDPWWNPAVEAQAVDRTHRIGQDRTVMVYRLVAAGTIEEKVMELKARKQALFSRVMDDDGLQGAPLTADDIRGLFG